MSYYDDASLVVIPSGYKTSKVYAEKPTDGSGDLAFTRTGDTATRVASNGLIERVRTNLVLQSQTFDNATWSKDGVSVSANTSVSPDGFTNADSIVENSATAFHFVQQTFTLTAVSTTYSIFAKLGSGTRTLILREGVSTGAFAAFNLSTGVVAAQSGGTATITQSDNGYYRCTLTFTAVAGTASMQIALSNSSSFASYTGNGTSSIIVYGAQVETGDVATPYIPTTTAAVTVGPVANVPRLDYLGSTCPRLLLEPQRTNFLQFSEQFDNAYWTKVRGAVTANSVVAPDGTTSADVFASTSGQSFIPAITRLNFTGAFLGNTAYSFSVFAKIAGNTNVLSLSYVDNLTGFTGGAANYNLATQAITITQSPNASVTASMQNYGNGWYRLVLNFLTIATPTYNYVQINQTTTTTGNGFALWGAQLEAGAYATSYIPTLAASVTRGADSSSSANISSLFGATEGSFYVQLTHDGRNTNNAIPVFLRSSINGNFNRATYLQFGATNLTLNVYDAGTLQAAISGGTYTNGQTLKIAFAYKANDFVLYVNGVQLGTDTSGAISSSLSFIDFGSYMLAQSTFQYDGKVSQALLFKTRLTNAELATLTTL